MQNYRSIVHPSAMSYDSRQVSYPIPPDTSIRERLNTHVKKRIGSPIPQTSTSIDTTCPKKSNKKHKKDPSDVDSKKDDEQSQSRVPDKHAHKPDILTSILNDKKANLMRDPEVIEFLKRFNKELQQLQASRCRK